MNTDRRTRRQIRRAAHRLNTDEKPRLSYIRNDVYDIDPAWIEWGLMRLQTYLGKYAEFHRLHPDQTSEGETT